eukprot:768177-Hanusia_phi.AAC.15
MEIQNTVEPLFPAHALRALRVIAGPGPDQPGEQTHRPHSCACGNVARFYMGAWGVGGEGRGGGARERTSEGERVEEKDGLRHHSKSERKGKMRTGKEVDEAKKEEKRVQLS